MCHHSHGGGSAAKAGKNYRLPKTVVPSRYELELTPNLTTFKFSGRETVFIDVLEPTDRILINAKELEIQSATVTDSNGTTLIGSIALDAETEIATITFAGMLGKGAWTLKTEFEGTHNDKLKGFYRSFWKDAQGASHTIVTTQFESTDARRAFPCWDEPDFKAVFSVKLVVDENLTAISNGKVLGSTSVAGGKKVVSFKDTIKMSSYLVAFIVGEFVSSQPRYVDGVEIRVWCVPGKEHLTDTALEHACAATAFYARNNESPFPGDKIDEIAIPDFASGAMENWGCITYRETALLCDPATATHTELVRVAQVVWHEHAHMDFGDKVTMKWWNGLWLNEAFATFMQVWGMSLMKPEWKLWEEFALSRAAAMRVDSLISTHPIESPVVHPDDAQQLFDVISYQKGCSVLYQIQQFIGPELFRRGVAMYVRKHAFANTETHDLWDCLEQACVEAGSNIPVRAIMDAWVFTAGHPVVSVKEAGARFVEVSQRPFKFLPDSKGENTLTMVPITMHVKRTDGTVEEQKFVLSQQAQTIYVGDHVEWVKLNAGGTGFYRVLYSADLLSKLTADVQGNLSVVERFNLVNDTWSGVRAQLTSATDYLNMVKMFNNEKDPNVWAILLGSLRTLHSLVSGEHRVAMQKLVRNLVKPTFDQLGWAAAAGESVQTRQLRGSVAGVLGTIGEDKDVQSKARELYAAWKLDKTSLDSNVVPSVISILAYTGDQAQYDEFFAMMKESTTSGTPQEVQRFLYALAGFRDGKLLDRTIQSVLSEHVRTQDAPYLFQTILMNEDACEAAWKFMQERWDDMIAAYPENGVVRMIAGVTALDTTALKAEVEAFFATHPVKQGDMAVAQALEQLSINVRLREGESARLAAHLVPVKEPAQAKK